MALYTEMPLQNDYERSALEINRSVMKDKSKALTRISKSKISLTRISKSKTSLTRTSKSNELNSISGSKALTILTRGKVGKEFYKYIKYRWLVLLFLPGLIYYIIFHYIPMYGVIIAFKDYKYSQGIWGSEWVGFEHFKALFSRESFWEVFKNTLCISFYKLVFGFPPPIILALMLNEVRSLRYKKIVQTVSYLPHFVSWVVLAGLFMQILSPSTGIVNQIIKSMGGEPIYFLADPKWFRTTLVVTSIWKEVGWGAIIYVASLSNINPDLYEAARIDGANRFKQLIYITLPSLAPVITIMFILATGKLINDDFDQIFNLYSPAVYKVGDVISTYTYRAGLVNMDYSYSTAVGLFKNIISLILIISTNSISQKINDYGLF